MCRGEIGELNDDRDTKKRAATCSLLFCCGTVVVDGVFGDGKKVLAGVCRLQKRYQRFLAVVDFGFFLGPMIFLHTR